MKKIEATLVGEIKPEMKEKLKAFMESRKKKLQEMVDNYNKGIYP